MSLINNNYKIKERIIKIIINIFLLIGGITMFYPFFFMVTSSFKQSDEIVSPNFNIIPTKWVLDNYKTVFEQIPIGRSYLNSFIVAIIVTLFVLLFSSMAAFMFAKLRYKGSNILFYIALLSLTLPIQTTIVPLYILFNKLKLVDSYAGIILPSLVNAFSIFLIKQFIVGIPDSLIDSAKIDGASDFCIYLKIILPLIKPILSIVALLVFIASWDSFVWPFIITNSPEMKTLPVMLAHFKTGSGAILYGESMAAATFVVVPVIFIYIFFQQNLIKSMTRTGMKG